MRLQDVILKTIAKKWNYSDASEIAGVSVPKLAWMLQDFRRLGYTGTVLYRSGRLVRDRVPLEQLERILALYQSEPQVTVQVFHHALVEKHGIQVNLDWLKAVLSGAGLISRVPESSRRTSLGRRARENRLQFPGFFKKLA